MTYVGEVGWELVVPVGEAGAVYDALWAAQDGLGLADAGYHAIEALRLEKGYRAFGRDLTPDLTPVEAGLVFATALGGNHPSGKDFVGRTALAAHRDRLSELREPGEPGERRRLVSFVLEDAEPMVWGGELLLRDGEPAGQVTSAAYGATVGACVGLALLRSDRPVRQTDLDRSSFAVDLAGTVHPARVTLAAPLR
jgi:4-methylaminobutanoate oxidase (formaldehyde-forming)